MLGTRSECAVPDDINEVTPCCRCLTALFELFTERCSVSMLEQNTASFMARADATSSASIVDIAVSSELVT